MKRKQFSLLAGAAVCTLIVLFTAVYAILTGVFVHAEYIPPCDIDGYAEEAIRTAVDNGWMGTDTVGDRVFFYPDRTVSRSELAVILVRFLCPKTTNNIALGFADEDAIPEDALPAIRTALANGYMKLHHDYAFHPESDVSREEMADIVGTLLTGEISAGKAESFSDFHEVSPYFLHNAKKAVDHGIMIGMPDGTFQPKKSLTRAELALILLRLSGHESFSSLS